MPLGRGAAGPWARRLHPKDMARGAEGVEAPLGGCAQGLLRPGRLTVAGAVFPTLGLACSVLPARCVTAREVCPRPQGPCPCGRLSGPGRTQGQGLGVRRPAGAVPG